MFCSLCFLDLSFKGGRDEKKRNAFKIIINLTVGKERLVEPKVTLSLFWYELEKKTKNFWHSSFQTQPSLEKRGFMVYCVK